MRQEDIEFFGNHPHLRPPQYYMTDEEAEAYEKAHPEAKVYTPLGVPANGYPLGVVPDDDLPLDLPGDEVTMGTPELIRSYSIAELKNMPDLNADWVVDRFLAVGAVTHLVAYIKAGKTTLSLGLIRSILHCEPFLEEFDAEKGPVVLLTEERPGSLLLAVQDAGIEDDDELRVVLHNEHAGDDWVATIGRAATYARSIKAKLLVVDTFWVWAGIDNENDSAEVRRAMDAVNANTSGLAVLLVMHSRKSGGEIHNAARGSSAAGGAADIIVHLDYVRDSHGKADEDAPERVMTMKSRLERDSIPPMKLGYQDGRYYLPERIVAGDARHTIRADLSAHGLSAPKDISARTLLSRSTVKVVLRRMLKSGEVEEENHAYRVAGLQAELHPVTPGFEDKNRTIEAVTPPISVDNLRLQGESDEDSPVTPLPSAGAPGGVTVSSYRPGSKCPMCGERAVVEREDGALFCNGCGHQRLFPDNPSPRRQRLKEDDE